MSKPVYLSVITPVYNESSNLERGVLDSVVSFLSGQSFTWEWLIIDDGSSDDTLDLLNQFALGKSGVIIVANPHQGKASSIMTGVDKSQGQIILFSDMDQATPISEFSKFIPLFNSGADIVIGSRSKREGAPFFRQVLAYGMVVLRTLLLSLPFVDTQCGFKAFTRNAAAKIFPTMHRIHPSRVIVGPAVNPGFDVELLFLGRKLGLTIKEVPVVWHHQDSRRVSFLRDAVNGVRELLLVRYRSLTNAYQAG